MILMNLFTEEINDLAREVAIEFSNRNLPPLQFFSRFSTSNTPSLLRDLCTKLLSRVNDAMKDEAVLQDLLLMNDQSVFSQAIEFSTKDGVVDNEKLKLYMCIALVQVNSMGFDSHISALDDRDNLKAIGLEFDDNYLVDLRNKRLELRRDGIIVDKKYTYYLHQFMRRMYSANFVGIPSMLRKFMESGNQVFVRLDPLRRTVAEFYRDGPFEADYWHGKKFSAEIFDDKKFSGRTLHYTTGFYNFHYDVRYTVFRTKMMDMEKGLREFVIEEYCHPLDTTGNRMVGFGEEYCIQKFAHFVYDQNRKKINHLDGAVRVFSVDEYEKIYSIISKGEDVEEHIGKRYKMFLVLNDMELEDSKDALIEWFRYNPLVPEYLTGKKQKPVISYIDYAAKYGDRHKKGESL